VSASTRTFFLLVILLAILSAANLLMPQGNLVSTTSSQGYPASLPVMMLASFAIVLVLYGVLGFLGLKLSQKLGIPNLFSPEVSNRHRFVLPAMAGVLVGLFLILMDFVFSRFLSVNRLPHPPFPTSLLATISAGIGEEILFRLFFISIWTWLISYILLRRKGLVPVYWVISTLSALVFSAGHFPSLMIMLGAKNLSQFSPALIVEVFLLNSVLSLVAAYHYKKSGYLAAASVHFWADVVWHVVWGMV